MDIQMISIIQKGEFVPAINKWVGNNLFRKFAEFCMSRPKYKRGKGVARSFDAVQKQWVKAEVYKAKGKSHKVGGYKRESLNQIANPSKWTLARLWQWVKTNIIAGFTPRLAS